MEVVALRNAASRHPVAGPNPVPGFRVLVVSNHAEITQKLPFSGIYVERQVHSLRRTGVEVATFDVGSRHAPWTLLRKWRDLRRTVRFVEPDVIHARYGTVTAALAALSGRPVVITFCGSDLNPGASVSALRATAGRLLSNLAALKAEAIICVSQRLRGALWWGRQRAVIIPDGVDLDLFTPGSQATSRRELGWPIEAPVVLFNMGDDPRKKGFALAEAAMRAAVSLIPDARLEIVQHVTPPSMPLYYRAADVLLVTSLHEGSPNVVKEALACNLPVVTVPVGDVEQRLSGVHPSGVVPRDPEALGRALASILRTRQRSNGRQVVASVSLPEIARQVVDVYSSVVRRTERQTA